MAKDGRVFDAHASANLATCINDDVWANLGRWVDLGGLMDDDLAAFSSLREGGALLLLLRPYVQALADDIVSWLTDIHPIAWKLHLVQVLLSSHHWENLAFD